MTIDELKKEARKDADSVSGFDLQTSVMVAKDKNHAYRLGRYDGYLSGAEPREKRIDELEATNKRISNECHTLVDTLEKKQKEVAELEQENAELKDDNKVMADNYSKMEQKFYDNLTKAKEIISEYVRLANLEKEDTVAIWQLYHKAEQFLSEVEK